MSREQTQIIEQQNKAIYEVSRFFGQSSVDGFDSLNTEHAPQVLKDIFDAVDTDFHKDIFDSVGYGIEQYKAKNGGEMPNPNVLTAGGIDPQEYTGFAWGVGLDRLTLIKRGINDIRKLRDGDLNFLRQF